LLGDRRNGECQVCGKQSREKKCTLVVESGRGLKAAGHLENLGVNRRILFAPILTL
jgi:hypothetical protein